MSYATSRSNPKIVFVTNGKMILGSIDGGAHFTELLSLGTANFSYPSQDSTITNIAVASQDTHRIYAAIEEETSVGEVAVFRPHVVMTRNLGKNWSEVDVGFDDRLGRPRALEVAPSNPDVAYFLVDAAGVPQRDTGLQYQRTWFQTTNGGVAWFSRLSDGRPTVGLDPVTPPRESSVPTNLAIDPLNAQAIWLWGGPPGLFRSNDGGQSVAVVERLGPLEVSAVDVYHEQGAPAQVVAFNDAPARPPQLFISDDGGGEFSSVEAPGNVISVVSGRKPLELVAALSTGKVIHLQPDPRASDEVETLTGIRKTDVSFAGVHPKELQGSVADQEFRVYARHGTSLSVWTAPTAWNPLPRIRGPRIDVPGVGNVLAPVPHMADIKEPVLLPRQTRIVMKSGESSTVPYQLVLPGTRQVDVFFLVDVSNSMDEEIEGLRAALGDIVHDLSESGIDAHFGVGMYRSYDADPYRRLRDIGPPNAQLAGVLNQMFANGGGDETQLAALYQVATGVGQNERGAFIAANQQANFRPGALRVIVHGTDEGFSVGDPHPTFEETIAALRNVDAIQLGLAFIPSLLSVPDAEQAPEPDQGLREVARGTGGLAPPEGADCTGDNVPEIPPGEPLVCIVDSERSHEAEVMAPAITNLIMAVRDLSTVTFAAEGPDGIVTRISPPSVRNVDFSTLQLLGFDTTFKCPRALRSKTEYPVRLAASARGAELASAEATVVCKPKPLEALPILPPPGVIRQVLPPIVPPPGIPPPLTSTVPGMAPVPQVGPAPAPASQPAPHPVAAAVPQPQEQPQVALVHAFNVQQERIGEQYAMSRFQDPHDSMEMTKYVLASGTLAVMMAWGLITLSVRHAFRSRRDL